MENAINIQVPPFICSQIIREEDLVNNEQFKDQEILVILSLLCPEVTNDKKKKHIKED